MMLSGATAAADTVVADRNRATADSTKIVVDIRTVEVSQDIVSSRELKSLQQDELAAEVVDIEKRGEARVVLRAKVTTRNRWPKKLVVPVDDSATFAVDVFPRLANAGKDVYLDFFVGTPFREPQLDPEDAPRYAHFWMRRTLSLQSGKTSVVNGVVFQGKDSIARATLVSVELQPPSGSNAATPLSETEIRERRLVSHSG